MKSRLLRLWEWALEHPILAVFVVALVVRAVVVVGINVFHDGTLFADDRFFAGLARDRAGGDTSHWPGYDRDLFDRTATFLWPLTAVFIATSSTLLAGQLLVAAAGAGAAALTTAVGVRALRPAWAIAAGLVVSVLPSMVLWSSLTLKDAFVWCTVAAIGLAVCELCGSLKRFVVIAAVTVVLLFLLAHLRDHSVVVACWALAASLAIGPGADRRRRAVFGLVVLLLLPVYLGYGVAGISYMRDAIPDVEERREGNAVGAASALTCGRGQGGISGKLEYLPCGFPAVMLRPYPWESAGSTSVRLARLEAILWYPLLVAALYGLTRAWPRRRWLAFPAINGGAIVLVYALNEGNLGTAFRHRAEAIWAVALFAALGAQSIVDRRTARSARAGPEPQHPTPRTAASTLTGGDGG